MELNDKDKLLLLKVARDSIAGRFTGFRFNEEQVNQMLAEHPELNIPAGAFVTLWEQGGLRGCIGYIISDDDLVTTVSRAAVQAAFHDPRFPAVREVETGHLEIEVSVLSPPFPMNSYEDIVIGKHGLILEEGARRGLLLPQVPLEHNMDRDEFLSALCEKAGLYREYWKEKKLNISMFTADVFSEKELKESGPDQR